MCGITGIMSLDGAPIDTGIWTPRGPVTISEMVDVLIHRGPDHRECWWEEPCALGHTRLSIQDLSPAGRQPMANEDETLWLVFNGEIYNWRDLRTNLVARGHVFRSWSDSEVILHLYEEWGMECLQRLDGMFAFALWDTRQQRLFLARDRLGVKPLYWQQDREAFRFASESKAILADPRVPRQANLEAVAHYLTFGYVPSPLSAFQGLHQLSPGSAMTVQRGERHEWPWYDLTNRHPATDNHMERLTAIRSHLGAATRARLQADVPVGVLLSGGIDSSAITAYASKRGSVKTFCMGFADPTLDERPAARVVAQHCRTDHHEFEAQPDPERLLALLATHYDEPFADSSALATLLLAEQVSQHVKVVLTGDGGDEAFGGYRRYIYQQQAARWAFRSAEPGLYTTPFCLFHGEAFTRITTPEFRQAAPRDGLPMLRQRFAQSSAPTPVDRAMDVDLHLYLPDDLCVKMDRATMAFGLEARSPFLDHHLVEYAATIPAKEKVAWGQTKRVLKRALEGVLPPATLQKRKMGFGVPLAAWLRGPWREVLTETMGSARSRGWIDAGETQRMLTAHLDGTADHATPLWYLFVLEQWARRWL